MNPRYWYRLHALVLQACFPDEHSLTSRKIIQGLSFNFCYRVTANNVNIAAINGVHIGSGVTVR